MIHRSLVKTWKQPIMMQSEVVYSYLVSYWNLTSGGRIGSPQDESHFFKTQVTKSQVFLIHWYDVKKHPVNCPLVHK